MGYSEDLAYIHDAGFTELARNAGATVLRVLRRSKIRSGVVVDLGCGSGVLAEQLTRAGYEVLGIDISDGMLKLARKRAPEAQFVRDSIFRAKIPTCVAVTAIGECLNYLFDGRSDRRLPALFRRVYKALRPGGIFMFDIAVSGGRTSAKLYTVGKDWAVLVEKSVSGRGRLLVRKMTIFRKVGRLYRRGEEVHRQRLYAPKE